MAAQDVLVVPAGWLHTTYTLDSGFLIGADIFLPGLVEVLAAALRDEWEIATRLADQENCKDNVELLHALATQLAKNHKFDKSDTLVAKMKRLLDWVHRLRAAIKEPASGTILKAVEKLHKGVEAWDQGLNRI